MRRSIALFVCAGLLVIAGSAGAFVYGPNGEGNPYYVPAIPERYIPTMDGSLGDWAWVPSQWVFTVENYPGRLVGEPGWARDDFDVIVYGPAWIPATNMYGFAIHKVDDIFYDPAPTVWSSEGESNQWCVDPDASGGPYPGGYSAQQNFFHLRGGGFVGCFQMQERARFIFEEPHCFWAATMDISTGSYDFELMYHLWDYAGDTEDDSEIHILEEGQSIGATLQAKDRDTAEGGAKGLWWHFAEPSADSGNYARFEMLPLSETEAALPTAVESTSWGSIKALMQ